MPMRDGRQQAQAARAPAVAPGHVGAGPGLVEEHQALGIERRLAADEDAPRLGDVSALLLGGVQAFY